MAEYVGQAHTDEPYPGILAEDMTAHAIERALAPLIAELADDPAAVGEQRVVPAQIVLAVERQEYEGLAPATVSVTATVLTGEDITRAERVTRS